MKVLHTLLVVFSAALFTVGSAQITITGGDVGIVFEEESRIEPGSFGTPEFMIVLTPGKNGKMVVGGRMHKTSTIVNISGNLTADNKILAKLLDKAMTPIDGRYNPNNDTIVITRIGNEAKNEVLKRVSTTTKPESHPIEAGQYTGRAGEPEGVWEITVSKGPAGAFNVTGHVTIGEAKIPIKGTLGQSGKLTGTGGPEGSYRIDGAYDFATKTISIKIKGFAVDNTVRLKPEPLQHVSVFGMVSKEVGNVPPPGGDGNGTVEGGMSEDNFFVLVKRRPESEGSMKITHNYSTTMGSTLKPGEIIELRCWSEAEKGGKYPPTIASGAHWIVEGDATILEFKKTLVGITSDGTFTARAEGITRFRVGASGTIRITAGQGGHLWGGSTNWNPVTYTFKYREPAKFSVGGGG